MKKLFLKNHINKFFPRITNSNYIQNDHTLKMTIKNNCINCTIKGHVGS